MADQATAAPNTKEDVAEAIELIEITRKLFQKNITALKQRGSQVDSKEKLQEYEAEAKKLYEDYKKSLQALEEYIDQIPATNQ